MAVSELSAEGAPSQALAGQLNALYGPCGLVCVMAVWVGAAGCRSRALKAGISCFAAMEWVCSVGYSLFPWVSGVSPSHPRNAAHLTVTVLVVVLSLSSLMLVAVGAGREQLRSLRVGAVLCLLAMVLGPIGTALLPKAVFGLFERFSTFSAVVFNALLGVCLMKGQFEAPGQIKKTQGRREYGKEADP